MTEPCIHYWGKPYFFGRYVKCLKCGIIKHLKDGHTFKSLKEAWKNAEA